MNKKEHPYAQVLRWIADGEDLQHSPDGTWCAVDSETAMYSAYRGTVMPELFRLKPRTININGHEVPEPMRVAPASRSIFWVPVLMRADRATSHAFHWDGSAAERSFLARGLCHATREAAEAHAHALLSFTTQEPT